MVQQLRIHLAMQGTLVQSLVPEDLTRCSATKPMHHNYGACALEPRNCKHWCLRTLEPQKPQSRGGRWCDLHPNRVTWMPSGKLTVGWGWRWGEQPVAAAILLARWGGQVIAGRRSDWILGRSSKWGWPDFLRWKLRKKSSDSMDLVLAAGRMDEPSTEKGTCL